MFQDGLLRQNDNGIISSDVPKGWKALDVTNEKDVTIWCIVDEKYERRLMISEATNGERRRQLFLYKLGGCKQEDRNLREVPLNEILSFFQEV